MKDINLKFIPFKAENGIMIHFNQENGLYAFSIGSEDDFVKSRDSRYLYKEIQIVGESFVICKNNSEEAASYRIFCIPFAEFIINPEAEEKFQHSEAAHLPSLIERGKTFDFFGVYEVDDNFIYLKTGSASSAVYSINDIKQTNWLSVDGNIITVKKGKLQRKESIIIKFEKKGIIFYSFFLLDKNKFFSCGFDSREYTKFYKKFENYLVIKDGNSEFVFELNENKFFVLPEKKSPKDFFGSVFTSNYVCVKTKKQNQDEKQIWYIISTTDWCRKKVQVDFWDLLEPSIENGKLFVTAPSLKVEIK